MTPEEHGKQLYESMYRKMPHVLIKEAKHKTAKICASICCDEIFSVLEQLDEDNSRKEEFRPLETYDYWHQVKEQIQSL